MRTTLGIVVTLALTSFTQTEVLGQCQRAGGGRGPIQASTPMQAVRFGQGGVNPIFAMQQALMQQQFATQHMRMQQIALREQARRAQLTRRRSAAQQRRVAELARREKVRAANLAKLKTPDSQDTLVALKSK